LGFRYGQVRPMRSLMFKCDKCGLYTLKGTCPKCGSPTRVPIPARFSPQDHYGEFRRRLIKGTGG